MAADSMWIRRDGKNVLRSPNGYLAVIAVRDQLWIGKTLNPDETLTRIALWCPYPAKVISTRPILPGDDFTRLYQACEPFRIRQGAGWYHARVADVLEASAPRQTPQPSPTHQTRAAVRA